MSVAIERGALLSVHDRDYNHASDVEYRRLRQLADQAFKKRQELSQQSQSAYKRGDGATAKELSAQAKKQLGIAEQYNMQAAEYVLRENNADSKSDEIDLHGLYVKEAQWILKKRIAAGVQTGETELKVIVGKGLHSQNGIAKIKPAVEDLCREAGLRSYIDEKNAGVMVVELRGASVPETWGTTPYSSTSPIAPENAYHQPGGYTPQHQPQYQAHPPQQQPYPQQAPQPQQPNSLLADLLSIFCQCVRKI